MEELGDYVLRRACLFMREHGEALGLTRMGVNLSVQQLLVGNSAGHLLNLIRSTGIDPRLVTLEITESVLIQSIDQAAQALEKLRPVSYTHLDVYKRQAGHPSGEQIRHPAVPG